jgi:thiol-disulfide isomerase/thioredoxin
MIEQRILEQIQSGEKTFLLFSADWCKNCQQIVPKVKQYVKAQNIILLEVKDSDSGIKEIKKILEVKFYPTLFIIENGKPQSKIIGADNIKKTLGI